MIVQRLLEKVQKGRWGRKALKLQIKCEACRITKAATTSKPSLKPFGQKRLRKEAAAWGKL